MNQTQQRSPHRSRWGFFGGVHPPQHKSASTSVSVQAASLPKRLVLPLHQHIGDSAEPLVEVGDGVLKGQIIARASGFVSAPIHAPSSGRVTAIGDYPVPHPSGLNAPCIVVETDGLEQWVERIPLADYTQADPSRLRNMVREAGIVGLGGAGFPAFIKLNPGPGTTVDTFILNGVECEPYITCDDMLMREQAQQIIAGMRIMRHALQAKHCVIAVEDNKPEAFDALVQAARDQNIDVASVPTIYPEGSEKQLIQVITGKEVPSNGLPIHVGVVCHNVGTAVAVHKAIEQGEPLISRYVTITGEGVAQARNLEVLFGTPVSELLQQCGTDPLAIARLIIGGPMMGYAMHSLEVPVVKTTNCVLAYGAADLPPDRPVMPCIRCGACAQACPIRLLPQQLYWYAQAKEFDTVQEFNLFDCIECGCCAYVCPSNIPLVQYYRYAKGEIWASEREKQKSDIARIRHEERQKRLERDKLERAARHKKKKAALSSASSESGGSDNNKDAILAAIERAQKKKDGLADSHSPDKGGEHEKPQGKPD